LEWLTYDYNRIGGWKEVDTKKGIEELIDKVDKS